MSSTVAPLPSSVRGHAEQRADRHHAGAADAGDENAVGTIERGLRGLGQVAERCSADGSQRFALAQSSADGR